MLVVEIKRDRWQELMKSKILYCSMIKIWKMSSQKLEIHLIKLGGMNIYFFLASVILLLTLEIAVWNWSFTKKMMTDHKYKNIKKVHKLVMCKVILEDFLTPKVNLIEITHSLGGYFNSRAKKIPVLITLYFKKNFYILFHEIFSLRQKSVL